ANLIAFDKRQLAPVQFPKARDTTVLFSFVVFRHGGEVRDCFYSISIKGELFLIIGFTQFTRSRIKICVRDPNCADENSNRLYALENQVPLVFVWTPHRVFLPSK